MSYEIFASFYDRLTENVDYKAYADYIKGLFEKYGNNIKSVLDVACGTGSLTTELSNLGYDMIGADASEEMLCIAQEKMYESSQNILYLCQAMDELDLYGTVNAAVCTLDSINHITDINVLEDAFKKISLFLDDGGIFIFDVNTIYKHREVLGNNSFVYDLDDLYCVWQSFLDDESSSVDIQLDFFVGTDGNYQRYEEEFSERAYTKDELSKLLNNAGFEIVERFAEMTENEPSDMTERIVYVVRKK